MKIRTNNINEFLDGVKKNYDRKDRSLYRIDVPMFYEVSQHCITCGNMILEGTGNLYNKMSQIADFTNNVLGIGCVFTVE